MADDANITLKASPPKLDPEVITKARSMIAAGELTNDHMTVLNEAIRRGMVRPEELMTNPNDRKGMDSIEFLKVAARQGGAGALEAVGGTLNIPADLVDLAQKGAQVVEEKVVDPATEFIMGPAKAREMQQESQNFHSQRFSEAVPQSKAIGDMFLKGADAIGVTPEERGQFTPAAQIGLGGARGVGATAPFVAGTTAAGAKILSKLPEAQRAAAIAQMGNIKRLAVDMARNPAKIAGAELLLGGGAGALGEMSVQGEEFASELDRESSRMVMEMTSIFGLAFTFNLLTTLKNVARTRGLVSSKGELEKEVGETISQLLDKDPQAQRKFQEFLDLQKETGLDLNLPLSRVLGSGEAAALESKVGVDPSILTQEVRTQALEFTDRIKRGQSTMDPESFQDMLRGFNDQKVGNIEAQLKNVSDEIEKVTFTGNTGDQAAVNEQAFRVFEENFNEAHNHISRMYDGIKNFRLPSKYNNWIQVTARRARRTGMTKKKNISPEVKDVTDEALATFRNNASTDLNTLREFDSFISKNIRNLRKQGDTDGVRRLTSMKATVQSIYKDLENASGLELETISILKEANAARKKFAKVFEDFEGKRALALTGQSQLKQSPEDFLNNFIKPSTGGKSPKGIYRLAEQYQEMMRGTSRGTQQVGGTQPSQGQELIKKHLEELAYAASVENGEFKPAQLGRFLNKYRDTIDAHGLRKHFRRTEDLLQEFDGIKAQLLQTDEYYKESLLKSLLETDDIQNKISTIVTSRQELNKVTQEVNSLGSASLSQAWKESVVDNILRKFVSNKTLDPVRDFDTRFLAKVLNENPELGTVIGDRQMKSLRQITRALEIAGKDTTKLESALTALQRVEHPSLQLIGTRIAWAIAGPLSGRFVATDLTLRTIAATHSKALQELYKEVLSDPKAAFELAKRIRDKTTAPGIKLLLRGGPVHIATKPATQGNLQSSRGRSRIEKKKELTLDQALRGK